MHVSHTSLNSNNNNNNNNNNTKFYLTCEQTDKLKHILDRSIPICSSPPSSFPTLNLTPRYFLRQVLYKLKEYSIDITSIRLNGGAASYVLVNDSNFVYRDIDILIHIKTPLSSEQKTTLFSSNNEPYLCDVWTIIKYTICSCLLEHITNIKTSEQQSQQYTHHYLSTILDAYAKKNIKISSEQDSWALLSLQNYSGQNLELKFVEHLKRQWQFSVDSFQINLEPLLYEKQINNYSNRNLSHIYNCSSISSITKTIKTKNLIIDAINGLTIIKKDYDNNDERNDLKNSNEKNCHQNNFLLTSTSPLRFGFFTPSSSPNTIEQENNIECRTLATITTISTLNNNTNSNNNNSIFESRRRLSKASTSTLNEESTDTSLQFHLSLNDDIDDGIVSDADDSANEDDDQVFRTPVDTNSAPPSPATIIAIDMPSSPLVIEVYSGYKDLHQALDHLNKKLIATYAPETMRGGGLLKYCDLLAQNYKVHDATDMFRMQRYMCSRFFIDYKTIPEQMHVITQYVVTHFLPLSMTNIDQTTNSVLYYQNNNQENIKTSYMQNNNNNNNQNNIINVRLCLLFFDHLSNVIQQSTVCLTHHDKEATLININHLKECYHYKYEYLFIDDNYHHQRYHSQHPHHYHHCSSSSSNSSRSSSPSSSSSNSYRYYRHNHNQRHQNSHYRHHNLQRQTTNSLSYHHGSRNYSNDFHTNQQLLTNHHYQRRHQS
ncbi:unnamed protein product [Rotaria sordida]|uniref:polynucleotide adenylyltransferase n=1 Tax=Rotaria sordida TaxID=392033 RepID=A0A814SMY6_9BILA|nr:unnamed protein product [Rotaria sordida]CAF3671593.1 unnamed protein product [Rotaria sordida]